MNESFTLIDVTNTLPRHPTKKYESRNLKKIKSIVIHTTDANWSIERLAQFDIEPNHISNTGCPAITYHDVIMPSGVTYHALPYEEISWHAGGYNSNSIAVALMYRVTNDQGEDTYSPRPLMMDGLRQHLTSLCLQFGISPDQIKGHRELMGTGWFFVQGHKRLRKTCPGMKIDLDMLRLGVAIQMQKKLRSKGLYLGPIDGEFGSKSKAALAQYKENV